MKRYTMLDDPFGNISLELWLMLASASCDTNKIQYLLQQPVNWDLLLQLAVHHRVYPLVYKTLSKLNNPAVPEYVIGLLRQKYQENVMQALSITGETVRIVKCLENNSIRPVVLKGAPLARHLYRDIALRPSRDIDILVTPEEFKKAQELLENEGYHCELPEYNMTSRQLQIFLKSTNSRGHFGYWHNEKKIFLELHWKLAYPLELPKEYSIKRIEMSGSSIPVLCDEECLLFLILHGAGHAWFRLRWLVDIAKLTQQGVINWDKIVLMSNHINLKSILHQSLILANQLLDVPMPHYLLPYLTSDQSARRLSFMAMNICLAVADAEINGSNDVYINYLWKVYNKQLRIELKYKVNYVSHYFGPHINDIKFISLPDRLYFLYYGIRPFTWLGRYLRKLAAGN